MHAAEKMPRLRRFVNRWMSARISKLAERPLPDSQCGFRLINLDALARMTIATAHFEIESEVLLMFARAGREIQFVPIQVIYKREQSKIHPWRDSVRWFRWWRQTRRARKFQIPTSRHQRNLNYQTAKPVEPPSLSNRPTGFEV